MSRPAAVLTDIEGTISSVAFVREEMVPYATQRLPAFVAANRTDLTVRACLDQTRRLAGLGGEAGDDALVTVLAEWTAADRKATPLKALQGMIWEDGFKTGALVSQLYPDALAALRAWHAAEVPLFVYSSGSVQAQRLFFAHTADGDLLPLFQRLFDTTTGPKTDATSYRAIAAAVGVAPAAILFLSDVAAELVAASEAGCQVVGVCRDGSWTGPRPAAVVSRFDDLPADLRPA